MNFSTNRSRRFATTARQCITTPAPPFITEHSFGHNGDGGHRPVPWRLPDRPGATWLQLA
jgi:hypothetical protein